MQFATLGLGVLVSSMAASASAQAAPHARVATNATAAAVATPQPQTWVSGSGSDGNGCTRTAPCATFAAALSLTIPGGEVVALDAGDYGPLVITQAVTISGTGGQVASPSVGGSSNAAITISAGPSDAVTIRNLDLNGFGQTGDGIHINSAKAVHLENLHILNFGGFGVVLGNSTNIVVTMHDSTSSNNKYGFGAQSQPSLTSSVLIAHSHFAQQDIGVFILGNTNVTVTDSDVARGLVGYESTQAGSVINLVRSKAAYESTAGVQADVNGVISMSDLTLANNGYAGLTSAGGQLISFGNNAFTNAVTVNTTIPLQ